jgi:hypothetical protein
LPGLLAQVHAQEAPKQDATDLDTVSVVGIRGSVQKSLDTKREAAARVEVVTAEDIGKLPATTSPTRCSACRASTSARPAAARAASTKPSV